MGHENKERRLLQRCIKDVSMNCSYLNEKNDRLVTVRNFSNRGMYFESDAELLNGSFVVLRATDDNDLKLFDSMPNHHFQFSLTNSDPEACSGYRSHTVARVKRCMKLDADDQTRFGIGAEILILND